MGPKGSGSTSGSGLSTGEENAQFVGLKVVNQRTAELLMSVYTRAGSLGDPGCILGSIHCCFCVFVVLSKINFPLLPPRYSCVPC